MCLQIHYLYPVCSCLAKIGKYTCYHARTSPPPSSPQSASSSSPDSPTPAALFTTSVSSSSSSSTSYPTTKHRFPTGSTIPDYSPLTTLALNCTLTPEEKRFTIHTCLSNRFEATSRLNRNCEEKFDTQCPDFKIVDQEFRGGEVCERCERRLERESRRERMERESRERVDMWEREIDRIRGELEGDMGWEMGENEARKELRDLERQLGDMERKLEMRKGSGDENREGEEEVEDGDQSDEDEENEMIGEITPTKA